MIRIFLLVFIICIASPSSANQTIYNETLYQQQHIEGLQNSEEGLKFLVLGDWGRNGHFAQKAVAHQMEIAMYQLDADFIVTTGDNFYPNGIASVDDPYWKTSYENIYHGPTSFQPWYVVLGNHDYRGNVQAQIDYTMVSKRWNMPARYYSKTFTLNDSKEDVLLLFIDTNPMVPEYKNDEKYKATQTQDVHKQLRWINKQLSESNAHWKIVIGHHPLYSSGKRYGKNAGIRNILEPILEKHGVDAYFAGHEHDLQHNQPEGKQVAHFISGAGSEIRKVAQREFTRYAESTAGFMAVSVTTNKLLVQVINDSGQVRYQYALTKTNLEDSE